MFQRNEIIKRTENIVILIILFFLTFLAGYTSGHKHINEKLICIYLGATSYNNGYGTCRFINKNTGNEKTIKIKDLKYYINY